MTSSKTIFQLILFLVIIAIFFLFYKIYFLKPEKLSKLENKIEITETIVEKEKLSNPNENLEETSYNLIEDIEYKSSDVQGNIYIIQAELAKMNLAEKNNENIIILKNVKCTINLYNKSKIYIFSDFAEHDKSNFDTKFYDKVELNYGENKLIGDNLDIFFKNNYAEIYNNVKFNNNDSQLKADKINFDILSGNININMFDSDKKILVLTN
tara:strand:- start:1643 stop:2275 length:633 start_codon:yes stop_codon:yes gene_type:complete